MPAFPINQIWLVASVDNGPQDIRYIKSIKVNSFSGTSILFSSMKFIQNVIR